MSDMIWMEHPELGPERRQLVSQKQFDNAWSKSGWVMVDEAEGSQEDSQNLEDVDYDLKKPSTKAKPSAKEE